MVREYEIQMSISEGVARVLRSEVSGGMDALRKGRAKAVRFEIVHESKTKVEVFVDKVVTTAKDSNDPAIEQAAEAEIGEERARNIEPGHCAGCGRLFVQDGKSHKPMLALYRVQPYIFTVADMSQRRIPSSDLPVAMSSI